ncbi:hypothetical protein Halha_2359 [Halobacteroides halobius DSM 5150]|uniref:LPP20 lipoprotein n=1 Tax=Halobacteroides halobius (strain ATCC 35273 / DSM 5150 / MD-1) TaxID=748449 RepID=L0KDS6_HALHC|nr:LPP20 family lipoprotein [Halobacteroides halobius]AGB42233.1 hypothetical protein Halha_2359 [Halobacteroides halobius DSM 5150]
MLRKLTVYVVAALLIVSMILGVGTKASAANNFLSNQEQKNKIDWEQSVVKATGYGIAPDYINNDAQAKIMAREAAITLAQRHLLETIKGVQVNATQTVKNAQIQSDIVKKRLSGMIKGAKIIQEESPAQGVYKVVMEVKFYGQNGIVKAIFPKLKEEIKQAKQSRQFSLNPSNDPGGNNSTTSVAQDYTGIIINTIGLDVEPALVPKIYSASGNIIYGMSIVNSNGVVTKGIVKYSRSLAGAKVNPRAGNNPLIINAKQIKGSYKTDIVLSNKQANRVKQVGRTNNIFANCKVIIVLN